MSSPAAWHTDPTGNHDHRWWDGTKWTEHVADAGESKVDHLDPADAPPAPTGDVAPPVSHEPDVTAAGSTAYGETGEPGGTTDPGTGGPGDAGTGGTTEPGTGGLAGAWEGTATPEQGQPSWQQPGAGDPNATAQPPAWQQGAGGGAYDQGGQYGHQPAWEGGEQYGQERTGGTDGVAIAALVIGILSLLTSWFVLGGLGGIIALVLGLVALGRIKRNRSGGRGMAITGVVTGVLSILIAIVVVVLFIGVFGDAAADYEECIQNNTAEACANELEDSIMDRFRNR